MRNSSSHAYTLSCPSKEEALALQGTIGFSFDFISFQFLYTSNLSFKHNLGLHKQRTENGTGFDLFRDSLLSGHLADMCINCSLTVVQLEPKIADSMSEPVGIAADCLRDSMNFCQVLTVKNHLQHGLTKN